MVPVTAYIHTHTRTKTLSNQLAQRWIVAAPGEFSTVPHQELPARLERLDGVEVDLHAALARDHVLLLHATGGIDVTHPVALLLVQTVQNVV